MSTAIKKELAERIALHCQLYSFSLRLLLKLNTNFLLSILNLTYPSVLDYDFESI